MGEHEHPTNPNDAVTQADLERRLADWVPSPGRLDRDRVLFAAGAASARRGAPRLAWAIASLAMSLALGLGVDAIRQRRKTQVLTAELDRTRATLAALSAPTVTPHEATPIAFPILAESSYARLRVRVMTDGLEGWAGADPASSDPTIPATDAPVWNARSRDLPEL